MSWIGLVRSSFSLSTGTYPCMVYILGFYSINCSGLMSSRDRLLMCKVLIQLMVGWIMVGGIILSNCNIVIVGKV